MPGYFQCGIGASKTLPAFEQNKTVFAQPLSTLFCHQLLGCFTLHRGKFKHLLRISFDNEINCTIAMVTRAIENNYLMLFHNPSESAKREARVQRCCS